MLRRRPNDRTVRDRICKFLAANLNLALKYTADEMPACL